MASTATLAGIGAGLQGLAGGIQIGDRLKTNSQQREARQIGINSAQDAQAKLRMADFILRAGQLGAALPEDIATELSEYFGQPVYAAGVNGNDEWVVQILGQDGATPETVFSAPMANLMQHFTGQRFQTAATQGPRAGTFKPLSQDTTYLDPTAKGKKGKKGKARTLTQNIDFDTRTGARRNVTAENLQRRLQTKREQLSELEAENELDPGRRQKGLERPLMPGAFRGSPEARKRAEKMEALNSEISLLESQLEATGGILTQGAGKAAAQRDIATEKYDLPDGSGTVDVLVLSDKSQISDVKSGEYYVDPDDGNVYRK